MSDGIRDGEPKVIEPEIVEDKPKEVKSQIPLQYVFITLSNGKRGAFAGPVLMTKVELMLNPPRIVDIVFSEPKYPMEQTNETDKKEENSTPTPA